MDIEKMILIRTLSPSMGLRVRNGRPRALPQGLLKAASPLAPVGGGLLDATSNIWNERIAASEHRVLSIASEDLRPEHCVQSIAP